MHLTIHMCTHMSMPRSTCMSTHKSMHTFMLMSPYICPHTHLPAHVHARVDAESMKMEVVISAPATMAGMIVKALPARPRSKTERGETLSPGDLLLEVHPPK